jgi:hypothetical protein
LFEGINSEVQFKNYVSNKYPKANIQRLEALGTELKKVAPRRNDAAHGGNYLTYKDVCEDKGHVYNISIEDFKGLILEFLDIII